MRQMAEATLLPCNKTNGKKVCVDRVPESSNGRVGDSGIISGNAMPQHMHENLAAQNLNPANMVALRPRSFVPDASVPALPPASHQQRYQMGIGTPRGMQDPGSVPVINSSGASPAGQDMMSYADNVNSSVSVFGKRENQDAQMSPLPNFNKKGRPTPVGLDGMQQQQQQQIGPHIDGLTGADINWKNSLLQPQVMARGISYANMPIQKFTHQPFEGTLNQDAGTTPFAAGQRGMRLGAKEEPFEIDKFDGSELNRNKNDMPIVETETSHLESQQSQQRLQYAMMRSNFPQAAWNGLGPHVEKDARKEDQLQKRKSVQSPRISAGALAQSPLSSKSGEFSSGSLGPYYGAVSTTVALGATQKEKSANTSAPTVGGNPSITSSANDSIQRQHQAQAAAKRRSNSLPKTPAMSGVASPASVSNMSVPLNANSPSVGTPPLADHTMLERFSKIEMVTMRYSVHQPVIT